MRPEPDIDAVRAEMSESFERIRWMVDSYRRELSRVLDLPLIELRPRLNWSGFIMLVRRPTARERPN